MRELFYLVTFLCVTLAMGVWSGEALFIVLIHASLLTLVIVLSGARLYPWIFAGATIVSAMFATWAYYQSIHCGYFDPPDFVSDAIVLACLGSAIGAALGLWKLYGSVFLTVCSVLIGIVDLMWLLLLPRIH